MKQRHTNPSLGEDSHDNQPKDYSLVGINTQKAIDAGMADADWYLSPIPKDQMRDLHTRKDWPALRDCFIYFGLLTVSAYATLTFWGNWYAVIPMMIYGVLYASASDSRWHESSHGTAFKTDWLNAALYEIASFMVLRESVPWRWSHTRHHTDTIIVGRDPEIAVPRPPRLLDMALKFINFHAFKRYIVNISLHCSGRVTDVEATFIPESERSGVYWRARIYALVYIGIAACCIIYQTWLPLVFVLGPNIYGAWLMPIYAWTQHAGLAEDVLDHRLNCRTIHMNFIHRFLYWNMNYHTEHHMFPLVPYHQLPRLHQLMKNDCPDPYSSLTDAYREIIPTIFKQIKDPGYYVKRELPPTARPVGTVPTVAAITAQGRAPVDGWIEVCHHQVLSMNDVIRFDHEGKTYAIYRTGEDKCYATDGICTHGNTHLADGLVKGNTIECPKHNGRFDVTDGKPIRPPVCVGLTTYPVKVEHGHVYLQIDSGQVVDTHQTYQLKVVSNQNVATFIKELVLEPVEGGLPDYQAGQYMQLDIPVYEEIKFSDFDIAEPYAQAWKAHHVFDYKSTNPLKARRNYSLARRPDCDDKQLHFNVRIATPPRGLDCSAGIGSSYVYNLKEGDIISAIGPFGDFLIKETNREMVYLGGGAGMAPLRSHLSYLFETLQSDRKVTFWYGARSKQEIFYEDYFRDLEKRFENFSFHIALSEPLPEDNWTGHVGFIHDILSKHYLAAHDNPKDIDYYLCGPPTMISAAQKMLTEDLDVSESNISFDEF